MLNVCENAATIPLIINIENAQNVIIFTETLDKIPPANVPIPTPIKLKIETNTPADTLDILNSVRINGKLGETLPN
jgi:hypothetical protein